MSTKAMTSENNVNINIVPSTFILTSHVRDFSVESS